VVPCDETLSPRHPSELPVMFLRIFARQSDGRSAFEPLAMLDVCSEIPNKPSYLCFSLVL